jgi:hypothetical protein
MRSSNMKALFFAPITALFFLAFGSLGWAAVTSNSIVTTQTPKAYKAQITNASGTTPVNLVIPGTNGTKVISIVCSNTDASSYNVTFSVLRSSTTYLLDTVAIPASAGYSASAPPVSILNTINIPGIPQDSDGNPYLFLEPTDTLQMANGSTLATGKAISCQTVAADF